MHLLMSICWTEQKKIACSQKRSEDSGTASLAHNHQGNDPVFADVYRLKTVNDVQQNFNKFVKVSSYFLSPKNYVQKDHSSQLKLLQ